MPKIFFKSKNFKNKNNNLNEKDLELGFNVSVNKDKIPQS